MATILMEMVKSKAWVDLGHKAKTLSLKGSVLIMVKWVIIKLNVLSLRKVKSQ